MLSLCHIEACCEGHKVGAALQGGIPKKHWDVLRREVLHTYGHEHVLTLAALQDAGGL